MVRVVSFKESERSCSMHYAEAADWYKDPENDTPNDPTPEEIVLEQTWKPTPFNFGKSLGGKKNAS